VEEPVILELDEPGIVVEAAVGETLRLELLPIEGTDRGWRSRGGPPGLFLRPDGSIDYDLGEDSVGWWTIVVSAGPLHRRSFELRVTDGQTELPEEPTGPPPASIFEVPVHLNLGLGVTGAAAWTPGSVWLHPGEPNWTASASPVGLGELALGAGARGTLALELMPLFERDHQHPVLMSHVGMDFRTDPRGLGPWRLGLFASATSRGWVQGVSDYLSGGLTEAVARHVGGGMVLAADAGRRHGLQMRLAYTGVTGPRATLAWCWITGPAPSR
jgi:hypothetical protein